MFIAKLLQRCIHGPGCGDDTREMYSTSEEETFSLSEAMDSDGDPSAMMTTLDIEQSIYSDAMIFPLCQGIDGLNRGKLRRYLGASAMLILNFLIQAILVYSLFMHHMGTEQTVPGLFQSEHYNLGDDLDRAMDATVPRSNLGVCALTPWDCTEAACENRSFHWRRLRGRGRSRTTRSANNNGATRDDIYDQIGRSLIGVAWMDCRPELVDLLGAWNSLDLNNDSLWSRDEAVSFGHGMTRTFDRWMNHLAHLVEINTSSYALMSIGEFQQQDDFFTICGILDPNRCGNMEWDGFLADFLPYISDPLDRIELCTEMVGQDCHRILGASYAHYQHEHHSLCGSADSTLVSVHTNNSARPFVKLRTVSYESVGVFNNVISSRSFGLFMILILFIWFITIMIELRRLAQMAEILWAFPGPPNPSDDDCCVVKGEDKECKVAFFTRNHRVFCWLGVWLPRLILCLGVGRIGGKFLTEQSKSFQDAILNGLALSFIMDIDDLLYLGTLSLRRRTFIERVQPLTLEKSCHGPWHFRGPVSQTFASVLFLGFISAWSVWYDRHVPYGWIYKRDGLNCFCEGFGATCTQYYRMLSVLGDSPEVPEVPWSLSHFFLPHGWARGQMWDL